MADENRLSYQINIEGGQAVDEIENLKKQILDLREKIANLRKEKLTIVEPTHLRNTTNEIKTLSAELGVLRVKLDKLRFEEVNRLIQQNTQITSQAGIALQSLNFVIRDSPYFFRDFSLGLLAIGNNLNPLIDSMLRAKLAAQEMNMTLGQALLQSLKGPNGVILAFSFLVATIQAVTFALASSEKESKKNEKSFADLEKQLRKTAQAYTEFKINLPAHEEYEELARNYEKELNRLKEERRKLIEEMRTPVYLPRGDVYIERNPRREELNRLLQLELKITELESNLNAINKTRSEYIKNLESINKIKTGEIKIENEIKRLRNATNNEIRQYVRYLEDERDRVNRNSEEYKRLDKALQQIKATFEDIYKKGSKIDLSWVKELIRADEQLFKARMKERVEVSPRETITKIDYLVGLQKLLDIYRQEQKSIDKDLEEYIRRELNRLEDNNRKFEDAIYYRRLEKQELKEQLGYLDDIGNSMDRILGKSKNWVSALTTALIQIARIAELWEGVGTERSEGTATLGTIASIFQIISAFAGFFDKGGLVFAKNGALIGTDAVPVIAHQGEMILNKRQQFNLFKMINRGAIGSGMQIHISGEIKARKSDFVVEFQRAQKIYNNSVYLNA